MGLQMLSQLLMMDSQQSNDDQGNNTPAVARTIILFHKNDISRLGIQRIKEIRNLKEGSEDKEYAMLELEEWESLMRGFGRAVSCGRSIEEIRKLRIDDLPMKPPEYRKILYFQYCSAQYLLFLL